MQEFSRDLEGIIEEEPAQPEELEGLEGNEEEAQDEGRRRLDLRGADYKDPQQKSALNLLSEVLEAGQNKRPETRAVLNDIGFQEEDPDAVGAGELGETEEPEGGTARETQAEEVKGEPEEETS